MDNSAIFSQKHCISFLKNEMYEKYLELHIDQVKMV